MIYDYHPETGTVSEAIMVGMKHGCTILPAKGAYTGEDCSVVLFAIHRL